MYILTFAAETAPSGKTAVGIAAVKIFIREPVRVTAVEHMSEQISKQIVHVSAFKMIFLISAGTARTCLRSGAGAVKGRMAELIVKLSLLGITQYGICLRDLFKLLLRPGVSSIGVGMVFFRQLAVSFFYGVVVCIFLYSQYFIIISFCCQCVHPLSVNT